MNMLPGLHPALRHNLTALVGCREGADLARHDDAARLGDVRTAPGRSPLRSSIAPMMVAVGEADRGSRGRPTARSGTEW